MKKSFVVLLILCASLTILSGSLMAYAAPVELSLVSDYPDRHPAVVGAFKPWIKQVEDMSGGKVKINYFSPNALVPQKDGYDSTVDGIVDILTAFTPTTPGKFPLCTVIELPFLTTGSEQSARMQMALYNKFPEWRKQFEATQFMWHWSGDISQIHTTKKLVKTLDDLKGMKIITLTPNAVERIKMLGGIPVELPFSDIFLALQRGMAEGLIMPFAAVRSTKVDEVAKFHTIINMDTGVFYAVMNKKKYTGLPADIRKILDDTTGEKMAVMTSKAIETTSAQDKKWLAENGHTIYEMPDVERAKLRKLMMPLYDKWVKDVEAKGFKNAKQILEYTEQLAKGSGK
jgi:TRAP-type transport system periplasmic protein